MQPELIKIQHQFDEKEMIALREKFGEQQIAIEEKKGSKKNQNGRAKC
jgi:hypothetical protein